MSSKIRLKLCGVQATPLVLKQARTKNNRVLSGISWWLWLLGPFIGDLDELDYLSCPKKAMLTTLGQPFAVHGKRTICLPGPLLVCFHVGQENRFFGNHLRPLVTFWKKKEKEKKHHGLPC